MDCGGMSDGVYGAVRDGRVSSRAAGERGGASEVVGGMVMVAVVMVVTASGILSTVDAGMAIVAGVCVYCVYLSKHQHTAPAPSPSSPSSPSSFTTLESLRCHSTPKFAPSAAIPSSSRPSSSSYTASYSSTQRGLAPATIYPTPASAAASSSVHATGGLLHHSQPRRAVPRRSPQQLYAAIGHHIARAAAPTPPHHHRSRHPGVGQQRRRGGGGSSTTALHAAVDDHIGSAVDGAVQALTDALKNSNLLLASSDIAATTAAAAAAAADGATLDPSSPAVAAAAADVAAAASEKGWFGQYVDLVQTSICHLHDALLAAGAPEPWGLSVVIIVVLLKVLVLPLNYKTIESSAKMKAIQPLIKSLQEAKTSGAIPPQQMTDLVQEVYAKAQVNPLGAVLPPFLQIPIFIGLYRSITNLAKDHNIQESFLWIPDLGGPVSERGVDLSWIIDFSNGLNHPVFGDKFGTHDTLAYLTLPALLVASQTLSMKLLSASVKPANQTPEQAEAAETAQGVLGFLPWLVGWFALSAPSALGVYWLSNNILTTTSTLGLRKYVDGRADILGLVDTCKQATGEEECDIEDKNFNDRAFLAQMMETQGKLEEAQDIMRALMNDLLEAKGPDSPDTARAMNALSEILRKQKKFDEAMVLAQQSLQTRIDLVGGEEHPMVARAYNNIAMLLWEQDNDSDEAKQMGLKAVGIMENTVGPKHPMTRALKSNWPEDEPLSLKAAAAAAAAAASGGSLTQVAAAAAKADGIDEQACSTVSEEAIANCLADLKAGLANMQTEEPAPSPPTTTS